MFPRQDRYCACAERPFLVKLPSCWEPLLGSCSALILRLVCACMRTCVNKSPLTGSIGGLFSPLLDIYRLHGSFPVFTRVAFKCRLSKRKQGSRVISRGRKHLLGVAGLFRAPEQATPRRSETLPGWKHADRKFSDIPPTLDDTNLRVKWL